MLSAPHHLAAQSGLEVLREGGNAIEAMLAAAATVSVVYPHMSGLGGDGFWLIDEPGRRAPRAITAVGAAGAQVDAELYRREGLSVIPPRGPLATITVAGTVSGWQMALDLAREWGGQLPLTRLFADAVHYARAGFPTTESQHRYTRDKREELQAVFGWADAYLANGAPPALGSLFRQPALAATLERLASAGLDDFYRGDLARSMAAELERAGSPLTLADLQAARARIGEPLAVGLEAGTVWNTPPPTQGLASLMILGIFDRLRCARADSFEHVHGLVEATKFAIEMRDTHLGDPAHMSADPAGFLSESALAECARRVSMSRAMPWPAGAGGGDTVWLGAIDAAGRAVSFIHSHYWEFGAGVHLAETGVTWQNRGASFSLAPNGPNSLLPGRLPRHTNNPALARLGDGRVMVYGAMGGDGQPQTQAALFTRYVRYGQDLQQAVTAPRWVLGRTWGDPVTALRVESRFPPAVIERLQAAGHEVALIADFDDLVGHAGAVVRHPSGVIEGAADPRADGIAAGY